MGGEKSVPPPTGRESPVTRFAERRDCRILPPSPSLSRRYLTPLWKSRGRPHPSRPASAGNPRASPLSATLEWQRNRGTASTIRRIQRRPSAAFSRRHPDPSARKHRPFRRFGAPPPRARRRRGNPGGGRNGRRTANPQNLPKLWPFSHDGEGGLTIFALAEVEDKRRRPVPGPSPPRRIEVGGEGAGRVVRLTNCLSLWPARRRRFSPPP